MCPSAPSIPDQPPPTNLFMSVPTTTSYTRNFYFNRLPRIWNKLPLIDLNQSLLTIKTTIYNYLQQHFRNNFSSEFHVPNTFAVDTLTVNFSIM